MVAESLKEKRDRLRKQRLEAEQNGGSQNKQSVTTAVPLSKSFKCGGYSITFVSEVVPHSKIDTKTYVNQVTNNRPQHLLNEVNLKSLIAGLKRREQLNPAYGFKHSNGCIEVIDGSRRRKSCNLAGIDFWVMVCDLSLLDFDVSDEEKCAIRRDLQTGKEQSIYDLGQEYLALEQQLGSAKAVADTLKVSEASVSRAKSAAGVSIELISLFEDYNVLSHSDFKKLKSLEKQGEGQGLTAEELAQQIQNSMETIEAGVYDEVQQAAGVVSHISSIIKTEKEKKKPQSDFTKTHNYVNGKKASYRIGRKTVKKGKNTTETFTLRNAPRDLLEKLDSLLQEHVQSLEDR